VGGDTVFRSGEASAAVVRVHGTGKALAITTDCTPRYCLADPKRGGAQAVAEAWRNLSAAGALPIAVTDNMNFGNPQKPRIMGQFAGCIEGMAEACRALDFPVVSGNVSLYNETDGQAILPTPAIGGLGLLEDAAKAVPLAFRAPGETVLLVGEPGRHLGQSLYLREVLGREEGPPPQVDLAAERRNGDFVRALVLDWLVTASHDVSDGGLLVALAEMAMPHGIGVDLPGLSGADAAGLFGEDQARYVLAARPEASEEIWRRAQAAGVPVSVLGTTGGDALTGFGHGAISVDGLKRTNEGWLPGLMAGELPVGA
jgi:phosphoribosylformylglycinamidine synthase